MPSLLHPAPGCRFASRCKFVQDACRAAMVASGTTAPVVPADVPGILAALSAIFLKGFKEAIGIATVLVGAYLVLNGVVVVPSSL